MIVLFHYENAFWPVVKVREFALSYQHKGRFLKCWLICAFGFYILFYCVYIPDTEGQSNLDKSWPSFLGWTHLKEVCLSFSSGIWQHDQEILRPHICDRAHRFN